MPKIIFAGTSDFGLPSLESIKSSITLIVTQPDRPVGRKQELAPSPVKVWAQKNNIHVIQPEKISEASDILKNAEADLMLVAAYGQIIPKTVLDIPKLGSVNIHGSLLPKYRGATPVQTAILNGDALTGITFIKMDEKMDHGPILETAKIEIAPNESFTSLYSKLSKLAAEKLPVFLEKLFAGNIAQQAQDENRVTLTKIYAKQDARIRWTDTAKSIHHMVMALNPEPGTWSTLNDKSVKIIKTEPLVDNKIELAGKIYRHGEKMAVKCADYSLIVHELQPDGKKPMPGSDFLNGLKNLETKIFV